MKILAQISFWLIDCGIEGGGVEVCAVYQLLNEILWGRQRISVDKLLSTRAQLLTLRVKVNSWKLGCFSKHNRNVAAAIADKMKMVCA